MTLFWACVACVGVIGFRVSKFQGFRLIWTGKSDCFSETIVFTPEKLLAIEDIEGIKRKATVPHGSNWILHHIIAHVFALSRKWKQRQKDEGWKKTSAEFSRSSILMDKLRLDSLMWCTLTLNSRFKKILLTWRWQYIILMSIQQDSRQG